MVISDADDLSPVVYASSASSHEATLVEVTLDEKLALGGIELISPAPQEPLLDDHDAASIPAPLEECASVRMTSTSSRVFLLTGTDA
ncbi:hypothetical protein [Paraburkholderia sp. GAS348]|uniref:hypothetical protein n=1 Tax=Paraburkholderia sp. GAS348 TaxID=3035132 RepID=UPI003D23DC32